MKKTHLLSTILLVVLLPVQVYSQPKKKFITVKKSATEKIMSGMIVGVTDSSLLVVKRSTPADTIHIHSSDIYSIRLGRPVGKGIVIGSLVGIPIGALVGAMSAATAEAMFTPITILTGEPTVETGPYILGGMLVGGLIGGSLGLVIDLTRMKKPIIVGNQQEAFSAKVGALTYYLVR